MTHQLVEQFRGKGPTNGGYVSGLKFKDLEGHKIAKWLRDSGYKARAIGGERYACAETECGMRVFSNGYICDVADTDGETVGVAQKFRNEAAQHDQNAHNSFERCDTDGFLSQWASGLSAELARAKAEIAENGGLGDFRRLFQVGGSEVDAKLIDGKYGACWLLSDEEADKYDRRFIPFAGDCISCNNGTPDCVEDAYKRGPYKGKCKKCKGTGQGNSRVQKSLGLVEGWVQAPAHAVIAGKGRGLSGSAWVEVVEVSEIYEIYKEAK